jgi:hypothetical protein
VTSDGQKWSENYCTRFCAISGFQNNAWYLWESLQDRKTWGRNYESLRLVNVIDWISATPHIWPLCLLAIGVNTIRIATSSPTL